MDSSTIVTLVGFSFLFIYGLTKILDFYGINTSIYGPYVSFYLFLLLTYFVIKPDYYKP